MVGVPEPLETSTSAFFDSVVDHDEESCSHNPASNTRTGSEVCCKESDDALTGVFGVWIGHGELRKVHHMGDDMNYGANDNGPCSGFMESDILVEGNDLVEGGTT